MNMTGNKAVAGVYKNHTAVEVAVMELHKAGLDMKTLSVAGKDYHSDDDLVAYYNTGGRMKAWGEIGGFWNGLWELLFGAAFFFVPGLGPIAVAGPLVSSILKALEGSVVVGILGAVGVGLFSIGIPKDSALKYETMLMAERFIVICHGAAGEVEKALSVLQYTEATEVNIHDGDGQTSRVILFCKKDK